MADLSPQELAAKYGVSVAPDPQQLAAKYGVTATPVEQRVPGNTPGERSQYLRTHPDAAKANREATAMHTQEPEGSMLSRLGSGLVSPITGPAREIWQWVTNHDAWVKDHIGNSTNDLLSVPLAPQAGQAATGDVAGAVGSTAGQALLTAALAKAAGPKLIDEPGAPGTPAIVDTFDGDGPAGARVVKATGAAVKAAAGNIPFVSRPVKAAIRAAAKSWNESAPEASGPPGFSQGGAPSRFAAQTAAEYQAKLRASEPSAPGWWSDDIAAQQPRPPMGPPQAPPAPVEAPPTAGPTPAGPISQVQQPVAPGSGAPQPAGVLQFPTRTPAMGEQMPAPEVQTSQMASEPTPSQVRGVEKTASNRTAKAQRFAQALHDNGISAADAVKIEAGHLGDSQIQAGMAPRWGNIAQLLGEDAPSSLTMPQIIGELRKLETPATGPVEVPSKRAPGGGMGGMKNYFVDPEAPTKAPAEVYTPSDWHVSDELHARMLRRTRGEEAAPVEAPKPQAKVNGKAKAAPEARPSAEPDLATDSDPHSFPKIQQALDELDSRAHQMTRQEWRDAITFDSPNSNISRGGSTKTPLTRQEANMLNRVGEMRGQPDKYPKVAAGDFPTQQQHDVLNGAYSGNIRIAQPAWEDLRAADHKLLVEKALAEGKPVSPEVLAGYADLKKAASAGKSKAPKK